MEKIYKVIYNNNGKLMSCMVGNKDIIYPAEKWEKDWEVEYKLNEWAKPLQLNTLLFVFTTLSSAQKFYRMLFSNTAKGSKFYEIYEGIARNLSKISEIPMHFIAKDFVDFWDKDSTNLFLSMSPAWIGTRLASEIKLLKLCPKKK